MTENVAQTLDMSHLRDEKARVDREYAELKKQLASPPGANEPDKVNPAFLNPEATFTVEYTDLRGKVYKGEFTNKILTVGEKIKVDILRARRMMNTPRDAMTDNMAGLLLMVSWLDESLKAKPKWAENLWDIYDEGVVEKVFETVAFHERTFHGREAYSGEGEI